MAMHVQAPVIDNSRGHKYEVQPGGTLIQNIGAAVGPSNTPARKAPRPRRRCPAPSVHYITRESMENHMGAYFFGNQKGQKRYVLHGLGGSGKTEAAKAFVYKHYYNVKNPDERRFSDAFWVDATSTKSISESLQDIAEAAEIETEDVLTWFANLDGGNGDWIMLFNNADDPEVDLTMHFPDCSHGNILITTRSSEARRFGVGPGSAYGVSSMTPSESQGVLLSHLQLEDPSSSIIDDIARVAHELGHFPLSLGQADATRATLAGTGEDEEPDKYEHSSIQVAWLISFERLSPAAKQILRLCAFLHHDDILQTIFECICTYLDDYEKNNPRRTDAEKAVIAYLKELRQELFADGLWNEFKFHEVIAELQSFSLILFNPERGTWSIHPLVHEWSRDTLNNDEQVAMRRQVPALLSSVIMKQAVQLKTQQVQPKAIEKTPRSAEDSPDILTLKDEVNRLREQLNRANALHALTMRTRMEPPSPTSPPLHSTIDDTHASSVPPSVPSQSRGRRRRSSFAGVDAITLPDKNPGTMSLVHHEEDNLAEEKIRLMQDVKHLDEDVLDELIRSLKFPAPSITNPHAAKEILFPATLIRLVTNEMWKYGLIVESERFLASVMQTIQTHVMSHTGEDAIVPGIFWLSNAHELYSFVCLAESDMFQGIGPGEENAARPFDWNDYERLVPVVKSDLDSLEYNIYHTWMQEAKKKLLKMVIPALIESQSLPGFAAKGGGTLFNRLLKTSSTPAYNMDDILNLLNKIWKSLQSYHLEESVVHQVITELLKAIGVTGFNELLMRRNFSSWKRAMQIQYNITRIEEWCKLHDMPEGILQLEHLLQATKLVQLKKSTVADIDIIYDVSWMLGPRQIQRMCQNYYVGDYESPISPEILKVVASRVQADDTNDHLLLPPENEEVGSYELPLPRDVSSLEIYVPAYLRVSHLRKLVALIN